MLCRFGVNVANGPPLGPPGRLRKVLGLIDELAFDQLLPLPTRYDYLGVGDLLVIVWLV